MVGRFVLLVSALAWLTACTNTNDGTSEAFGSVSDSGGIDDAATEESASDGAEGDGGDGCAIGSQGCQCTAGGSCDPGLMCANGFCVGEGGDTADDSGDSTTTDGDSGDTTTTDDGTTTTDDGTTTTDDGTTTDTGTTDTGTTTGGGSCGTPPTDPIPYGPCLADTDCPSGWVCATWLNDTIPSNYCSKICGSDADCDPAPAGGSAPAVCDFNIGVLQGDFNSYCSITSCQFLIPYMQSDCPDCMICTNHSLGVTYCGWFM